VNNQITASGLKTAVFNLDNAQINEQHYSGVKKETFNKNSHKKT
jgi:hypothetical protein